jgi:hypothetical protein
MRVRKVMRKSVHLVSRNAIKQGDAQMTVIYEAPMNLMLAVLCFLTVVGAAWRGARLLAHGLCQAEYPYGALWVVRGIRGVIIAVSIAALGGGVLLESKGLLVFGATFLGEELYETGVVILALRASLTAPRAPSSLAEANSVV